MNDEATLEQLERTWVEALQRRDVGALAALWSEGFVFTDPHGQSLSRERCLAEIESGTITFTRAEIRSLHVRVFDDTGIVIGVVALEGRAGARRYDGDYSMVDVYRRDGDRWRAVLSSGDYASAIVTRERVG